MKKLAVLMSTIFLLLTGCGTSAYANAMKDATSEVENGEFDKALESLDVALEEKPEDKEARTLYENIKALNQVKEAIDGTDWEEAVTKAMNLLKEDTLAKGIKAEAEQYINQAESELAAANKEEDTDKEKDTDKEELAAESGTNASEKEEAVITEEKPTAEKAKSNIAVSEKEVEANTEKKSIDKAEKANSEAAVPKEAEDTNTEKEKAEPVKEESDKIAGEREKYLKKLNDIKKGLAEFDKALETGTQVEMTQAKGEIFKRWDTVLNEIYGALENQLSTSKFESLREEQHKWLTYRDEVAKENSLKFEGGTMASLEYISTQARVTEERCYELVEGYME
jgi:uncharacterized protein YecT (DUF1311 family)